MEVLTTTGRKTQIREVAQNLFREKGYAATSMRELAKTVGIEPASLYSHYPSKASILLEICTDMAGQFFNAIKPISTLKQPAAEKLRQMIVAHIEVIWRNMDAATVFFHEWRFLEEPGLTAFKAQRKEYENYFRMVLTAGVRDKTFDKVDMSIALPTLFSAMNWTYDWAKKAEDQNATEVGNKIFELFFSGLRSGS